MDQQVKDELQYRPTFIVTAERYIGEKVRHRNNYRMQGVIKDMHLVTTTVNDSTAGNNVFGYAVLCSVKWGEHTTTWVYESLLVPDSVPVDS